MAVLVEFGTFTYPWEHPNVLEIPREYDDAAIVARIALEMP